MNPTNLNRRQFLRRTGGGMALTISLVDLIPVSSQASAPQNCAGYQDGDSTCQNAGDDDEHCGKYNPLGEIDDDAGCKKSNSSGEGGEKDGACGKATSQGSNNWDPDGHCKPGPAVEDIDAGCRYLKIGGDSDQGERGPGIIV